MRPVQQLANDEAEYLRRCDGAIRRAAQEWAAQEWAA
jgi:hypothetical protein